MTEFGILEQRIHVTGSLSLEQRIPVEESQILSIEKAHRMEQGIHVVLFHFSTMYSYL